ncbi:MAG: 50S ribosomal protein L35 [Candidatus Nephthysia bennettiae]|uniref:Large ribosomal subunit protein bL35 n=1 Tax=Candidatus Nephthysia bennettiae TaxID=3127016 RepID=A0A934KA13_9BACT|nr:50S ribosomal protein L35 [Candidatus Dormibacteraeota bacterium]MBJ7611197.1 50S ribosomal protein L35 [Candidatus Dormibacteraeota bacterium]PZR85803.1 MAG: 50S ribosomal protein L35 [Candidatus Dormibacteraeota bacterium]
MPKLKTRKGLRDRIRVTRTGKLMRRHGWKSHLLEHKSAKRKRAFGADQQVSPADAKQVRRALGI